jgi:hypothetical protein
MCRHRARRAGEIFHIISIAYGHLVNVIFEIFKALSQPMAATQTVVALLITAKSVERTAGEISALRVPGHDLDTIRH